MPRRDPYRALADGLRNALGATPPGRPRTPLHLTVEEWALVIDALDRAAKPYARGRSGRRALLESDGGGNGA